MSEDLVAAWGRVLARRRRFILRWTLAATLVSVPLSLVLPKTYTARLVILLPREAPTMLAGIASRLPGILPTLAGEANLGSDLPTIMAILKSRTLAERVIEEHNLDERLRARDEDDAIRSFRKRLGIHLEDEGTIAVTYAASTGMLHPKDEEDEARRLSAAVANSAGVELNRRYAEIATEQARQSRVFLEKRFAENDAELREAEASMRSLGEASGIAALPEQLEASIAAAAAFESDVLRSEIEVEAMRRVLLPEHPLVREAEATLAEKRRRLSAIHRGDDEAARLTVLPSIAKAPALGLEYVRARRDVEARVLVYQFLTQQLEEAKLQEAKDTPAVQFLDPAKPPLKKSAPRRTFIVAGVFVSSLVVAGSVAAWIEGRGRAGA